jgi:AcrR family transcriptional regulator
MASVEIPFAASANTQGTYDRILDVSEALFAKLGIVGTSVRTITDEAHVNVAAVNYHFGTKDNLVHAVIKRRFESLEQERADALDQIEELCARENRAPKPYELASVLISPTFAHIKSGDEGWMNFIRCLARLMWEPGAEKFSPPSTSLNIFDRFDKLLQQAVPSISQDAGRRCWRIAFMRSATQQTMLTMAMLRTGQSPNAIAFVSSLNELDADEIERELITFVAAGLSAH